MNTVAIAPVIAATTLPGKAELFSRENAGDAAPERIAGGARFYGGGNLLMSNVNAAPAR
jgi:hypothetical protein